MSVSFISIIINLTWKIHASHQRHCHTIAWFLGCEGYLICKLLSLNHTGRKAAILTKSKFIYFIINICKITEVWRLCCRCICKGTTEE